jgi:hypothetical protein
MFTNRLREGVRRGEITYSVRIWMRPRVTVGVRYRMGEGEIEADSIDRSDFRIFRQSWRAGRSVGSLSVASAFPPCINNRQFSRHLGQCLLDFH